MEKYNMFLKGNQDPNHAALRQDDGKSVTYGQLNQMGNYLAECISGRTLVFILCSNSIGAVFGYLSCITHRIPVGLFSADINQEQLERLIDIYKPGYIWLPCKEGGRMEGRIDYKMYSYILVRTKFREQTSVHDDLAVLVTTSGSTGSPKLVRQSYFNLYENAKAIAKYLKIDSTERAITTLPMNYVYGLSIINSHLYAGALVLLTSKGILEEGFWEFFRKEEATSFGGVPYTYEMLDRLGVYSMELPSLSTMTQAGGKLSSGLHGRFAEYACRTGKKFVVMYGASEATARMAYLPPEDSLKKTGSIGIAIPGGMLAIYDENGKQITTPGEIGELIYRGPNVTMGYALERRDLAKGDENHGILRTGDLASFDADGYFYIAGRKKRFLKIYGNRINLDEIDRIVTAKYENIEMASSGCDDRMFIFVTEPGLAEKIREYLIDVTRLPRKAIQIVILDQIPRNAAGKVMYQELNIYIR